MPKVRSAECNAMQLYGIKINFKIHQLPKMYFILLTAEFFSTIRTSIIHVLTKQQRKIYTGKTAYRYLHLKVTDKAVRNKSNDICMGHSK